MQLTCPQLLYQSQSETRSGDGIENRQGGWGTVPQRAVRADVIVVASPVLDQDLRFFE
jgi:hypothetical protein